MNWWEYPQKIKNWDLNIDYVMFIDENGNNENIQSIYKKTLNNEPINNDEKYFTITGCVFERRNYSVMRNNVRKLKSKYWENGFYFLIQSIMIIDMFVFIHETLGDTKEPLMIN